MNVLPYGILLLSEVIANRRKYPESFVMTGQRKAQNAYKSDRVVRISQDLEIKRRKRNMQVGEGSDNGSRPWFRVGQLSSFGW